MADSIDTTILMQETETLPPSQRVVETVAEAEGVDPIELDPIFSAIDPDALDSLFRPQLNVGEVADSSAAIRFEYHGYVVRVAATGQVALDPIRD